MAPNNAAPKTLNYLNIKTGIEAKSLILWQYFGVMKCFLFCIIFFYPFYKKKFNRNFFRDFIALQKFGDVTIGESVGAINLFFFFSFGKAEINVEIVRCVNSTKQ